jgi:hypothetical protein
LRHPMHAFTDAPLDTQLWRDSVDAARRYRDRPNTQSLFPVFDAASGQENLWNAYNRGGVREASSNIDAFPRFEEAMASGDKKTAMAIALAAVASLSLPEERLAMRVILAARAMLAHRAVDVADRIIGSERLEADWPGDAVLDQFLLRMRCRARHDGHAALLEHIVAANHPCAPSAACEWMAFRWRYEGPSRRSLDENLALAARLGGPRRLLAECLSQAFVIDPDFAHALVETHPSLCRSFTTLLPLAVLMRERGIPSGGKIDVAQVHTHAQLHDELQSGTRALEAMVRDAASLAIVGNSPCERGRGSGKRIDAHDTVARFNAFSTGPEFSADYGETFAIHVRSPNQDAAMDASSPRARLSVLCQGNILCAVRNWRHAFTLRDQGATIACLPLGAHDDLRLTLHAEPSLGLAFLSYVKGVRGELPRGSCFGFSFTDQIGPNASPAHYFDDKTPALTHQWAKERLIFDAMVS